MSTVSPAAVRDLAKQVEAKGAQMLDSPVSGSVTTLEEGGVSSYHRQQDVAGYL